ncbi:MAG: hypothetical protein V7L01_01765 [Nostoc sp.]|uniref:hypothetical protein n=1 Tax=Nostoc sp. TaxID=1180 RepID=UPI002FF93D94
MTLYVLKPSSYWEFPVVKLVNFLIYLFALIAFDFFLRELIFYYNKKISLVSSQISFKIPYWAWIVSGYILFIVSSLQWIGVASDSPDMLLAAFIYFAAGLLLRIYAHSESWFNFIILGVVLGFGYLSKAPMFPLAFVFLLTSMFSVGNLRRALPRTLAALLVFTIIVTPFIAAISTAKGRLTFGDAGKLNYAWTVIAGVTPYRGWQGNELGMGTPKHPPRQIFDNPKVLAFETPIGSTYPLWHDPSYWYEGLKLKFNLERQRKILAINTIFFYKQFLGGLVFIYLILICVKGRPWLSVKDLIENWILLIPAITGLGIYMLVANIPDAFKPMRYIAPFIVLLFAGVFSSVHFPNSQKTKRLIAGTTVITSFIIVGQSFYSQFFKNISAVSQEQNQLIELQVADTLHELGVQPGEKVAILGYYIAPYYHWARLARAKIVVEIFDEKSFWEKNTVVRTEILKNIEKTGARVIVQKPGFKIPNYALATGWREIGNTGYYVYFLQKSGKN